MNYIILGLDINEEDDRNIKQRAEYYGCSFENTNSVEKLEKRLKTCEANCVVVMQLGDTYTNTNEEKYVFTAKLKTRKKVKVLYISKNIDKDERLRWLSYGAAGYIICPYHVEEILRQSMMLMTERDKTILADENFVVNLREQEVLYRGKKLPMTPNLFKLILYLIENPGTLVTRDDLMREVYSLDDYLSDRNIDTLIKLIRKRTDFGLIKTVRGQGYIYKPNVAVEKKMSA